MPAGMPALPARASGFLQCALPKEQPADSEKARADNLSGKNFNWKNYKEKISSSFFGQGFFQLYFQANQCLRIINRFEKSVYGFCCPFSSVNKFSPNKKIPPRSDGILIKNFISIDSARAKLKASIVRALALRIKIIINYKSIS